MPRLAHSAQTDADVRPGGRRTRVAGAQALVVSALLATTGVALGAVAALPRFASPRRIIASTPNVPAAVSGAGEALTLRPGAGPGPVLDLATAHGRVRAIALASSVPGFDDPSVAIGDSGVLAATWDTSSTSGSGADVVEVAIGTFGAPPTSGTVVSPIGATVSGERAFVNAAGTAFVLWNESVAGGGGLSTVRAAIVPPGGAPRAVTIAANESLVGAGIDASGELVVIEQDNGLLTEQTISAGGTVDQGVDFTPPPAMSAAAGVAGELGVLVDGQGDQLYSWRPLGSHQKLNAVWRSTAGSFGPVQALGVTADIGADRADVALNATGRAVAVLTPRGVGPLSVRFASRLGHFGPVERIGAAGRYADMPALSISGSNRTLLAWLDSPASARGTTRSRALVAEAHGTRFGTPTALPVGNGLGRQYLGDSPLPAADPSGKPALVTYGASNGSRAVGQIVFVTG
jgi:hypothetical protein